MRMRKAACASVVCGSAFGAFVIACGSDKNTATPDSKPIDARPIDTVTPDASPYDFSCLNNPPPGTGSASITLSGAAVEVSVSFSGGSAMPMLNALGSASVDACKNQGSDCTLTNHFGTTATTDGSGNWSIGPIVPVPANSPLDAYLHLTPPAGSNPGSGDVPVNVYPAFPFVADQANIPIITFPKTLITELALLAGKTQHATNGAVLLLVQDCASKGITGATIHAQINGTGTDYGAGAVAAPGLGSGSAGGGYIVFDVPPGAVTLSATVGSVTFRTSPAQVVTTVASELTATQVVPGAN